MWRFWVLALLALTIVACGGASGDNKDEGGQTVITETCSGMETLTKDQLRSVQRVLDEPLHGTTKGLCAGKLGISGDLVHGFVRFDQKESFEASVEKREAEFDLIKEDWGWRVDNWNPRDAKEVREMKTATAAAVATAKKAEATQAAKDGRATQIARIFNATATVLAGNIQASSEVEVVSGVELQTFGPRISRSGFPELRAHFTAFNASNRMIHFDFQIRITFGTGEEVVYDSFACCKKQWVGLEPGTHSAGIPVVPSEDLPETDLTYSQSRELTPQRLDGARVSQIKLYFGEEVETDWVDLP